MEQTKPIIEECLKGVYKFLLTLEKGGDIIKEGGVFGDLKNDTVIRADEEANEVILNILKKSGVSFKVFSEECELTIGDNPTKLVAIDPLDGSLNFRRNKRLPYAAVIAIFSSLKPKFIDAEIGGVIDLRNGTLWIAEKGKGCYVNGAECQTSGKKEVDGESIIIGEFYYPENREIVTKAFRDFKGYLRNPGASAYEMTFVADGAVDLYISNQQKNHELGTAYLLIKEAGGTVIDFDGNDIGKRDYEFNSQTPVIAAATLELAEDTLRRIQKAIKN